MRIVAFPNRPFARSPAPPVFVLSKKNLDATFRTNVILLCLGALLYGLLEAAHLLHDILVLLGVVLMVTYLLLGPVSTVEGFIRWLFPWLEKRLPHFNPRILSVLLVYIGFAWVVFLSGIQLVPALRVQVRDFAHDLPFYYARIEEQIKSLSRGTEETSFETAPQLSSGVTQTLRSREAMEPAVVPPGFTANGTLTPPPNPNAPSLDNAPYNPASNIASASDSNDKRMANSKKVERQLVRFFQHNASQTLKNLLNVATHSLLGAIHLIVCLVLVFYFLLDGKKLTDGFIGLLPPAVRPGVSDFLTNTHVLLYTFIRGQVILGFLAAFYMYGIYALLGLKYAVFLGFLFGFASLLPVVGPWVGILPAILVVLFSHNPLDLVPLLLLAGGFYFVKENWITPKIVGNTLEIHPVMVILAFLACLQVAGMMGIFLSFPLASLISVTIHYFMGEKTVYRTAEPEVTPSV